MVKSWFVFTQDTSNKLDVLPKRTKRYNILVIYYNNNQIQPKIQGYQVSDLILREIRTADKASHWLITNLGMAIVKIILLSETITD